MCCVADIEFCKHLFGWRKWGTSRDGLKRPPDSTAVWDGLITLHFNATSSSLVWWRMQIMESCWLLFAQCTEISSLLDIPGIYWSSFGFWVMKYKGCEYGFLLKIQIQNKQQTVRSNIKSKVTINKTFNSVLKYEAWNLSLEKYSEQDFMKSVLGIPGLLKGDQRSYRLI